MFKNSTTKCFESVRFSCQKVNDVAKTLDKENFMRDYGYVLLAAEQYPQFIAFLERDLMMLRSNKVVGYSFRLGVHDKVVSSHWSALHQSYELNLCVFSILYRSGDAINACIYIYIYSFSFTGVAVETVRGGRKLIISFGFIPLMEMETATSTENAQKYAKHMESILKQLFRIGTAIVSDNRDMSAKSARNVQ